MPTYRAPLDDIRFVLGDLVDGRPGWLGCPGLRRRRTPDLKKSRRCWPRGARFAGGRAAAAQTVEGDREGCTYENGVVRTPEV